MSYLTPPVPSRPIGIYGDGRDGAVHITTDTALSADINATTVVVDSGVSLFTSGHCVRATQSVTNNGTIADWHRNTPSGIPFLGKDGLAGNNADAPGNGGGGVPAALYGGSGNGGGNGGTGAGQNGFNGTAGISYLSSSSIGGNGGADVLGANAGGTGATFSGTEFISPAGPWAFTNPGSPPWSESLQCAPGGGAGGGDGVNPGGGGGAGGGIVALAAPAITNAGVIDAGGGNGGAATIGAGGGGGGGAGGICVTLGLFSGTAPNVAGGTAGLGNGGGANGTDGVAGVWVRLAV